MRVGVVPKFNSPQALELSKRILEYGELSGLKMYIDSRGSKLIDWDRTFTLGKDDLDLIIIVGGDGTVLNTLHLLGDKAIPVATIRYGRRGFLCDVAPFEYRDMIDRIVSGRYRIVKYMRLKAEWRDTILPYALNEYAIVTSGEARTKVARIHVWRDSDEIYYLVGDGVIVAPPIGSTAYSLAAGGPVVEPTMRAIIITPLAPITFCCRPVVLPPSSIVRVIVSRDSPPLEVISDGNYSVTVRPSDEVRITEAPTPALFARFYLGDYYVRLFERCM